MNSKGPESGGGKVFLVGAGPGDPGLITVRGRACLEQADVVLYDGLANAQLLRLAPQATCICVGKHGQTPIWTQADINAKLVELGEQGRRVVRLKGGDPAVFARTAEELEVLADAGIPFEVVPGITAALAAASYVGIPITHRQYASAVAFVTGQQQAGGQPQPINWQALADFPGTLVLYMGVTTVDEWTNCLLSAGKSAATPAAIIRRCSWSDQSVLRCTLGEVAGQLQSGQRVRPPVIVIVGEVAALGANFDWFSSRPLHGCGVLVTRTHDQADDLVARLEELGAEVYQQPVVAIVPPGDLSSLDAAIEKIKAGIITGLSFSSSNGVDGFFARLHHHGLDARSLAGICLVAVGPATASRLRMHGLRADVVPSEDQQYSARGMLAALPDSLAGQRWIVSTTQHSAEALPAGLRARGAEVDKALCYETRQVAGLNPDISSALQARRIQFVTVTSSIWAEACYALLAEFKDQLRPVSLSVKTSNALARLGWPAAAHAEQHTSAALVEALLRLHLQETT